MKIEKFKLLYKFFISSEKKWQLPKKAQILICDSTNKEVLKPYLKKVNFCGDIEVTKLVLTI